MSNEIEILQNQILLQSMTHDELLKIYPLLEQKEYDINDVILEEGDMTTDLYFLKEGEVVVLTWDQDHKYQLPLARFIAGQMFGEMSFMDGSPRSSTIKATKHTIVWKLSREKFDTHLPEMASIQNKLITNIAIINIQRIRSSNQSSTKNLRSELGSLQRREEQGEMAFSLVLLIGFLVLGTLFIKAEWPEYSLDLLYLSSWLILYPLVTILVKSYHYDFSEFSLIKNHLMKTIITSLVISVGAVAFLFLCNWIYHHFAVSTMSFYHVGKLWIALYLIYCYAYEFIVRGVLQTTIRNFLNDESGRKAVFLTASFITLLQLPLFYVAAFPSWIANILLGAIYLRQQNIVGVFIIHFVLGIFIKLLGF